MTDKARSAPSLTEVPSKKPKITPPKSGKESRSNTPQESIESRGVLAKTPSQLAEDLKISVLALNNMNIREGDTYAIEGQVNTSGVLENTIVQSRGNTIINRQLLPAEYDYRGTEWTPTKALQMKLVRPSPTADFAWNNKFSVPGRNLADFQAEVTRIAAKIQIHCQAREGLQELSAQCKIQGEHGVNKISVPKNWLQEVVFPNFWNKLNVNWINRLATLIELPVSASGKPNIQESRAVAIAFIQESIDLTVSAQSLEKKMNEGRQDYQEGLVTKTIVTQK
jgi:hypothetical protein